MTTPAGKASPKGAEISRIGKEPDSRERFLAWLRRYATFLSIAGVLILVVMGANALLWQMAATRFDDTAARIDDTRAEVESVERRLTSQIKDVKTEAGRGEDRLMAEVGRVEDRLGKRIDDVGMELRDARQERKTDMNALRQDIQGLRHDVSTRRDRPGTTQ